MVVENGGMRMDERHTEELKRVYRLATIIGIAMISCLLIYAFIVEFIKVNVNININLPSSMVDLLRYLFFGIAIGEFLLIKFLRSRMVSGAPSPAKIQKLLSMTIFTYALCESVAIYGLILFLIGGKRFDFYSLMILSLIFFAIYFPRYAQWEEWLQKEMG
jgi:F0F1-type ATP synthase membrane subunit c/vacuolar-type H+-ATPase subunit K